MEVPDVRASHVQYFSLPSEILILQHPRFLCTARLQHCTLGEGGGSVITFCTGLAVVCVCFLFAHFFFDSNAKVIEVNTGSVCVTHVCVPRWGRSGPRWGLAGASLRSLWTSPGFAGIALGLVWIALGLPGASMGSFWASLEPRWGHSGPRWAPHM